MERTTNETVGDLDEMEKRAFANASQLYWSRWVQLNIEPTKGTKRETLLEALDKPLASDIASRRMKRAVFMIKSPGMRLRIHLYHPGASNLKNLSVVQTLDDLVRDGVLAKITPSAYEPEVHQFGGLRPTIAVHSFFAADSLAAIKWPNLARIDSTAEGLTFERMSLGVMNDLFFRTLGKACGEEVWDVWCNVALLHGMKTFEVAEVAREPAESCSELLDECATDEERSFVQDYEQASIRYAAHLNRMHRQGRLLFAYRHILPFICLFHWNRYALSMSTRAELLGSAVSSMSPKRGLR